MAVQDHLVVTIDTKELIRMSEEDKDKKQPTGDENGFTPEQVEQIKQIVVAALAAGTPATDENPEKKETTDGDPDPEKKTGDAEAEAEKAVEDAEAEAEKRNPVTRSGRSGGSGYRNRRGSDCRSERRT
ncbi:hypothetical protein WKR00_14885 [Morganella morganii]